MEWEKYRVGDPTDKPVPNSDCRPFDKVSHVSHLGSALEIMGVRTIRAGLVYDESKLNTQRTLACWVSPNFWGTGFRYGNVQFILDWKALIQGKSYYWVETIGYEIPACRILITAKRYQDLEPYNPAAHDGPWWYDEKHEKHYYNGDCCLEFMLEDDLAIDESVADFVDHHPKWCSMNRNAPHECRELGLVGAQAGGVFVAGLVSRGIIVPKDRFRWLSVDDTIPWALKRAFTDLYIRVVATKNARYEGPVTASDECAVGLARAVCSSYFYGMEEELTTLRAVFQRKEELEESVRQLLVRHFDLPTLRSLSQC